MSKHVLAVRAAGMNVNSAPDLLCSLADDVNNNVPAPPTSDLRIKGPYDKKRLPIPEHVVVLCRDDVVSVRSRLVLLWDMHVEHNRIGKPLIVSMA